MERVGKIPGLGGARVFTIIEDLEHTARCVRRIRMRWDEEGVQPKMKEGCCENTF